MVKVTVLYDQPEDAATFEKYYLETHVPEHGARIPNLVKAEINKVLVNPGEQPQYYRTADLYFNDFASFQAAMATPTGQAAVADLENFAPGRYKLIVTEVVPVKIPATTRA